MHAFGQILRTEAKLHLRDWPTILTVVGLPVVILVVLGAIPALREPSPDFDGQTFISYFSPSLLVMTLAVTGLTALPSTLATYRERGMLRRLATTPASPAALLVAQLLVTLATMVVGAIVLVVVARLAFGVPLPAHALGFTVAFVLGTGALLAVGLLVAALARTAKAAQAMSVPLFMATMFFGGVYLPRFMLPEFLVRIGDWTPPGVQALLDAWTGTAPGVLPLVIMAVIAVLAGTVAAKLFRWE
ncbi:ABC transporter [Micromonospora rosaria]|uniref:Transport permease protein n=1 Tax=Micromonospora rosaria TaxID=47874 RepID=A0A136PQD3_9ACTN|nr:ABC transporter permease [Micromonospora rosaria]KXK60588.1 ABC transporter [Micromonospora rosaria]